MLLLRFGVSCVPSCAALSTKCLLEFHSKLQTPALSTPCMCVCECVCEHGIVNTHSARGVGGEKRIYCILTLNITFGYLLLKIH